MCAVYVLAWLKAARNYWSSQQQWHNVLQPQGPKYRSIERRALHIAKPYKKKVSLGGKKKKTNGLFYFLNILN